MPERRLYNALATTTDVTDLLNDTLATAKKKIQPDSMPTRLATLPYITYGRVSTNPVNHSEGVTATLFCRIQVDMWAATYTECKTLADAVRDALSGWSDTTGDPEVSMCHQVGENDIPQEPNPDQDAKTFGVTMDFLLTYNAA